MLRAHKFRAQPLGLADCLLDNAPAPGREALDGGAARSAHPNQPLHRRQDQLGVQPRRVQHLGRDGIFLSGQAEQQVLAAHIAVSQLGGAFLRHAQGLLRLPGKSAIADLVHRPLHDRSGLFAGLRLFFNRLPGSRLLVGMLGDVPLVVRSALIGFGRPFFMGAAAGHALQLGGQASGGLYVKAFFLHENPSGFIIQRYFTRLGKKYPCAEGIRLFIFSRKIIRQDCILRNLC
ncbi:hypothetical protein SDC9_86639 [bioreactor metagenome]|uniref:Uncharacterized protein n=1 Tax=bioreactor metagenome TaxID=1076179 RepID=A0A644ZJH7_9ZZZZ